MTNDLTFTGKSPVILNYNGSADDIYAPVRSSSCDINIVSSKLLTDLYTSDKDGVMVKIEKKTYDADEDEYSEFADIWNGYMTPNTYTQEVSLNLDEISLTAIDAISIMKYVSIDRILSKPNILTYKELIGLSLAYVKLDCNTLYVERAVSYGGTYTGSNGLLDLSVQVSNFWDEAGEPETIYSMIEEMLRPFCMVLCYGDNKFQIYNQNKISGTRTFDVYTIGDDGTLTKGTPVTESTVVYDFDDDDWKSNNTTNTSLAINETYDKVTGVASTSIPEYGSTIFDLIDYNNRDQYDAGWLNVERNKVKGLTYINNAYIVDSNSHWFYLWNGVYTDEDFDLESVNDYVNGWLNINNAYKYLYPSGTDDHPNDYGSIANFYGGVANATGTSKTQSTERQVEVKRCVTAYAADNGTVPEFLERSDLSWSFDDNYEWSGEGYIEDPEITKTNSTASKYGTVKAEQTSSRIVYHQEYPNMQLIQGDNQVLKLTLKQAYSRTGINTPVEIYTNSITESNQFIALQTGDNGDNDLIYKLMTATLYYFPTWWQSSAVKVQKPWFTNTPKWDKRRIDMYVKVGTTYYQFNGKEWISGSSVSSSNSFYLCKLMNGQNLFHTDMSYDLIECSDGNRYSLTDESITVRTNRSGEVVSSGGTSVTTYTVYNAESNEWYKYIDSCGEGELNIILPDIDAVNATVYLDIYNSTFLGRTGDFHTMTTYAHQFQYQEKGTVTAEDGDGEDYTYVIDLDTVKSISPRADFIPDNVDYVKAEHLDFDIEVTVPESNLGQMFSESDIKYTLDQSKGYLEKYEGPTFRVNTFHQLVKSSQSYLIYSTTVADPGEFVFGDTVNARPECFTVQAYMNWLSTIRKTYEKTLVPSTSVDFNFCNIRTYLKSPEVGNNNLTVVKDSIDLKTNRHTIQAIENQDMDVDDIDAFGVVEIPRRARNERYNLPTSEKK